MCKRKNNRYVFLVLLFLIVQYFAPHATDFYHTWLSPSSCYPPRIPHTVATAATRPYCPRTHVLS